MKLQALLLLSAVCAAGLYAPAANADSYSSMTTTEESRPVTEMSETRTTTVESAPSSTTVIREQPVIVQPANTEVIVVKKHQHHLIHIGPVKVF